MALSKIKSDSIDSIDAAKIPNLDANKITTGTVDNARITLDATEIPNLDAAKITTGTVASARMGTGTASSSTVLYGDGTYKAEPVTDTTSIKNDISLLALQNAINGNLSAYGLKNSWIEQFENSNSITSLTDTFRNADEYMSAAGYGSTFTLYGPLTGGGGAGNGYNNSNTRQRLTFTQSAARIRFVVTSNSNSGALVLATFGQLSGTHGNDNHDTVDTPTEILWGGNSGSSGVDQTSDWLDFPVSAGSYVFCGSNSNHNNIYYFTTGIPTADNYDSAAVNNADFGPTIADVPVYSNQDYGPRMYWMSKIEGQALDVSATGSFTSTDIVPQDTTNKSSVGLVLLYKDGGSSSCTLNTDVIAKVRANTGQAYQTLSLAGAGTYSDSLKIAIAPAISVTAGQALSYEISFANQSAGTKEARIHGVAMTY